MHCKIYIRRLYLFCPLLKWCSQKKTKPSLNFFSKKKGWKARRIAKEFPSKKWTQSTIDRLITKIQTTGTTDRKRGSGRPTTVSTPENVAQIEELAASQEDMPGTHLSQRKISRHLNIKRASVQHILSNKIKFKALRESKQAGKPRMSCKRENQVSQTTRLLQCCRRNKDCVHG